MSENDNITPDAADATPRATKSSRLPAGSVVRVPHSGDRFTYALVVGYSDPVKADKAAGVEAAPNGYPLLLDLHGQPREHQADLEKV